jgi:hypothetical protein
MPISSFCVCCELELRCGRGTELFYLPEGLDERSNAYLGRLPLSEAAPPSSAAAAALKARHIHRASIVFYTARALCTHT